MTLLLETKAAQRARANFIANGRDPELLPRDVEFVFGRDGCLTARENDSWWTGCSIPRRAAMAQLKTLDVQGPVACFLAPPHSAAIRFALETMREDQAIIAIVPSERDLNLMLACENVSEAMAAHRIWFAGGDDWAMQLDQLFDDQPGLSIPSQFIRLNTIDPEQSEPMIAAAQRAFSSATTRRAEAIRTIRSAPRENTGDRLCIVAGRTFRLWNDWGESLADSVREDASVLLTNSDDPATTSPLAVARACASCDAIVTIDLGRADARNVASDAIPWITLIANPRIPAPGARHDQLILIDPSDRAAAIFAGWNERQLHLAAPRTPARVEPTSNAIALIADTLTLEPPASIDEFSSHRPLWESVASELSENPFAVGVDVDAYLTARMKKFDVSEQTLDRAAFTSRLILHAYMQGVARTLLEAKLGVQLWGDGWQSSDRFARAHSGLIPDRATLNAAIDGASTLIHAFPSRRIHPLAFTGRPVVRAFAHRTRDAFIRGPKTALAAANTDIPTLSADFLRDVLGNARSL